MTEINWEVVNEYNLSGNNRVYRKMMKELQRMNILSIDPDGNYMVMGCGVHLNPSEGGSFFFFTEKGHAKEFKEEVYGDAMYGVSIHEL